MGHPRSGVKVRLVPDSDNKHVKGRQSAHGVSKAAPTKAHKPEKFCLKRAIGDNARRRKRRKRNVRKLKANSRGEEEE